MKKVLLMCALPLAMLYGAEKKAAPPPTLPKGAVQVDAYSYRYTDSKGVKWLYRQTPFGLVKLEDKPAAPVVEDPTPTTVTDLGDSVKFERKTPFGLQSWTKKKADLTDEDKALISKAGSEKQ